MYLMRRTSNMTLLWVVVDQLSNWLVFDKNLEFGEEVAEFLGKKAGSPHRARGGVTSVLRRGLLPRHEGGACPL